MRLIGNMGVGGRFRLAFGGLLLVLLLLGGISMYQVTKLTDLVTDLAENRVPSVIAVGDFAEAATRYRLLQEAILNTSGADDKARTATRFETAKQDFQKARTAYEPMINAGVERETLMPALDAAWARYIAVGDKLMAAQASGKASVTSADPEFRDASKQLWDSIKADQAYNDTAGRKAVSDGRQVSRQTVWAICVMTVLGVAIALLAAAWLNRNVTARISRLAKTIGQLAKRDYAFDLPCTSRSDEIGDMARAIDSCRGGLMQADALAAEQAAEQEAKLARANRLDAMTREFESKSGRMIGILASASTELQATSASMSDTAGQTMEWSGAVSIAANQASGNVQTVAVAAEELVASVAEITRQITHTSTATNKAADEASQTQATVRLLADAAERIGQVVNLISNIAGQTNLLALNATIEAARAGDAGKGFAVVASEVKALASQTAKATGEIAEQVQQIQGSTKDVVNAIESITLTIRQVSQTTSSIAAAVEEQGAATQEIARNIQQASTGTQDVTQNIGAVSEAADGTSKSAHNVLKAANDLSAQTETFGQDVTAYLEGVRAA